MIEIRHDFIYQNPRKYSSIVQYWAMQGLHYQLHYQQYEMEFDPKTLSITFDEYDTVPRDVRATYVDAIVPSQRCRL